MENEQNNIKSNAGVLDIAMILDDMWRGLMRFGWLFLVVISIGASAFYVQAKRSYAPVYEAYSSFVVNTKNAYGYSDTYYNKTTAEQMSKTFPYIMTSGVLKQVVAESLGMEMVPADITADAMEETALFTIKVTAADAQLAYDVLQAVIENYPTVAEYIIGDTQLVLMDESGVPQTAINVASFKDDALKGAVVCAVVCAVFLILYALTRNTVRREEDLKERLSIPYLGSVQRVRFKKRRSEVKHLILMDEKEGAKILGETFRTLRTRLTKEAKEQNIKQIMVTSAAPSEGKSTMAANLAISLAKKGKKVVLVDADLRNPSITSVMGLETPKQGIVEALINDAKLEEVLIPYKELPLKVLAGVDPVANPTRMLGSKRMGALLEELSAIADYVIVDASPCTVVSDAALLARYVQGTVFVVRQDYANIDRIAQGVETIAETGTKMLGYVLNGTEIGITGYGHGYGYGYGYGHGYGYRRYGYGKYGYSRYGYSRYGYSRYGYGEEKEKSESKKL